jgi:hypothetical protein
MGSSGGSPAQFLDRAALIPGCPLQAGTALGGSPHAKKAGAHEKRPRTLKPKSSRRVRISAEERKMLAAIATALQGKKR